MIKIDLSPLTSDVGCSPLRSTFVLLLFLATVSTRAAGAGSRRRRLPAAERGLRRSGDALQRRLLLLRPGTSRTFFHK